MSSAMEAAPRQARMSSAVSLAEESDLELIVMDARNSVPWVMYSIVKDSVSSGMMDSIVLVI